MMKMFPSGSIFETNRVQFIIVQDNCNLKKPAYGIYAIDNQATEIKLDEYTNLNDAIKYAKKIGKELATRIFIQEYCNE